jgi:hypothetical protein
MTKMDMSEYVQAGVNYQIMEPFKMAMIEAGKKNLKVSGKTQCGY